MKIDSTKDTLEQNFLYYSKILNLRIFSEKLNCRKKMKKIFSLQIHFRKLSMSKRLDERTSM